MTFFNERPESLVYHDKVFHVFDIKVFDFYSNLIVSCILSKDCQCSACQCSEITFGDLDEVLTISGHKSDCHEDVHMLPFAHMGANVGLIC